MMKRATTVALSACALALVNLITGCGGGSGDSGPPPNPTPQTYTVGGTVTGLSTSGLVLQDNGGNDLSVAASGAFTFTTALTAGAAYSVTIKTQPASATEAQTCSVSGASGTVANGNVTTISVTCATTAINGIPVPPDPGASGTTTIAGIDSDGNGIRDDVDIFIARRYGPHGNAVKAARLSAHANQEVVTADVSKNSAQIALQDSSDAGVCAGQAFEAAGFEPVRELNEMYLRTYNTPERLAQYKLVVGAAGLFTRSVTTVVCP